MSTLHVVERSPVIDALQPTQPAQWFAVQTRPRHEKKAAAELQKRGFNIFLPVVSEVRQWSDRRMRVELPLFSCYAFVNMVSVIEVRAAVLQAHGVLSFVGIGKQAIPIPAEEIENIRTLLARKVPFMAHPFLEIGQRVRIRGGALDGIEGILERRGNGNQRLVISVHTIQRSLSVQVDGYQVEAVGPVVHHA
jgi:transcriptional antiterminator NusG